MRDFGSEIGTEDHRRREAINVEEQFCIPFGRSVLAGRVYNDAQARRVDTAVLEPGEDPLRQRVDARDEE